LRTVANPSLKSESGDASHNIAAFKRTLSSAQAKHSASPYVLRILFNRH